MRTSGTVPVLLTGIMSALYRETTTVPLTYNSAGVCVYIISPNKRLRCPHIVVLFPLRGWGGGGRGRSRLCNTPRNLSPKTRATIGVAVSGRRGGGVLSPGWGGAGRGVCGSRLRNTPRTPPPLKTPCYGSGSTFWPTLV